MPYAASGDLYKRFDESEITTLASRDGTGASAADVIDAALVAADNLINGYVGAQYDLPLTSTPALLTDLACDIARYRLWKDRASEQVRQGYEDAVSTLKRIADGTMRLQVATGPVASQGSIAVYGRAQVFTDTLQATMP